MKFLITGSLKWETDDEDPEETFHEIFEEENLEKAKEHGEKILQKIYTENHYKDMFHMENLELFSLERPIKIHVKGQKLDITFS